MTHSASELPRRLDTAELLRARAECRDATLRAFGGPLPILPAAAILVGLAGYGACPTAAGADPCAAISDPLAELDCRDRELERSGWRAGEETDPITDARSVVLRTLAEAPPRVGDGLPPPVPTLTVTCYRGREFLVSIEAGEALAEGNADAPAEAPLTLRIGDGPPQRRVWRSTAPDYSDAYIARYDGALLLARALAAEGDGWLLARYRTASGDTRTPRFALEGLGRLLPRAEDACR